MSFMERENIIGIALVLGTVIVVSLLILGHNSNISSVETNLTKQPVEISESQSDQVLGRLSHTLSLDKTLPPKTEYVMAYKTVPVHYSRQDIISLAKKFNMSTSGRIKEVSEGSSIASVDGKEYAILHNSGFVEYRNSNRAHTINPLDVPENLPSDEEAVKIATKFLKNQDLFPEGAIFSKTNHGKIFKLGENGNDIVVWEDVEVWFGRELNGNLVEGTQLMLAIGGDGDPIEYFTNWRIYESYKEYPIISPDEAFEQLKKKGVSVGTYDSNSVISIDETYLAYRTKPGAETEEYLEPVWVFKGDVTVDEKPVMYVKENVPAFTDESVKSLSS